MTETIFALDGMGLYFITQARIAGDSYPVMAFLHGHRRLRHHLQSARRPRLRLP